MFLSAIFPKITDSLWITLLILSTFSSNHKILCQRRRNWLKEKMPSPSQIQAKESKWLAVNVSP